MKSLIYFLRFALCLFVAIRVQAQPNDAGPVISPDLIAMSVAWQVHWDKAAGVPTKAPATLTFKVHDKDEVWIAGLNWIISFAYEGNQAFPNYVQRLSELPSEVSQRAMLPFSTCPTATVDLPAYASSFHKIRAFKPEIQKKLLDGFKHEACSSDVTVLYKDQAGRQIRKPRFWIAPVDIRFPVVLYYVEGVPYVGQVYFDTHSLRAIYSEFDYSGDEGTESRRSDLKLMQAIRTEGQALELENGQLVLLHGG